MKRAVMMWMMMMMMILREEGIRRSVTDGEQQEAYSFKIK